MLVIMLILLCFTFYNINYYLFQLSDLDALPSLDRMASIFEEGFASLNDSGSERSVVWINAISVIKYTLGFGVGLVDYVHIGSQINGILLVAHNTYLQILRNGAFYSVHYLSYLCFIYCLNYLDLTFLEKCNSNCCNVDDADLLFNRIIQ